MVNKTSTNQNFLALMNRRERDLLRMSPNQLDEEAERWCGCVTIGVGAEGCCPAQTSPGEAVRSALLLVTLAGLSLLTWLALHLQNRLDTTQRIINTGQCMFWFCKCVC